MKNHNTISKTSMRFAILNIFFLLFFVSEVQSKVYTDTVHTVSIDTIVTDSTYLITKTTMVETTSIDSAYSKDSANSKMQSKIDASNPLYVNHIKKKPEGKIEIDSAMAALSKGFEVSTKMFKILVSAMDSTIMKRYLDSTLTVSSANLQTVIIKMNSCIESNDSSSVINGLDILIKLDSLKMNGKKITALELSPSFIASVTIDDLKRTTDNLIFVKEQLANLKNEHSVKVMTNEIANHFNALFKDPLIVRILENALTQAQATANKTVVYTKSKSVSTSVTYTVKRENELNQQP